MKQKFLKFSTKKLVSAALLSTLLLSSFYVKASSQSPNVEIFSGDKTSIQFTGSTEEALSLQVHIVNQKGNLFTLTVKNDVGDILFSKSFNDISFEKNFKIIKGEQDNGRYYFSITSKDKDLEQTFVVNKTIRTVDDVSITKL